MKTISLYCDGSSLGNPGYGGWCGILHYKGVEKIISGGEKYATNNQMELKAVIESLKILKEPCRVLLYTDSKYVCEGINSWLPTWVEKKFKNIKNPELWKEYLQVSNPHMIEVFWVKGHSGNLQNERCDKIAKAEANKMKGA